MDSLFADPDMHTTVNARLDNRQRFNKVFISMKTIVLIAAINTIRALNLILNLKDIAIAEVHDKSNLVIRIVI